LLIFFSVIGFTRQLCSAGFLFFSFRLISFSANLTLDDLSIFLSSVFHSVFHFFRPFQLHEMLDILEELEEAPEAIYIAPPNVNIDSDEDSGEEDKGGLVDNLNARQLEAPTEAVLTRNRRIAIQEDLHEVTQEITTQQNPLKKTNEAVQKNRIDYHWSKEITQFTLQTNRHSSAIPATSLKGKSPVEKFEFFFDDELLNLIADESRRYASEKHVDFQVNPNELRVLLGILLLSGYHPLPSRRMYWSLDSDLHVPLVANAMSRNRFDELLRYLHFKNNQNLDKNDKFSKVRPVIDHLNEKFIQAFPMDTKLDLDEAMIQYFGRHGCKQCIRNKPIRFGFKAWCLNSCSGYLLVFDVYQGANNAANAHEKNIWKRRRHTSFLIR